MKKKIVALFTVLCCMHAPFQAFAKEIPDYYQSLNESKYERTSRVNDYQVGDLFYATAGSGKIYYLVCDDGVARLCTPEGEIVTYQEVQEYFGLSVANTPESENTEADYIPEEKESVKQENEAQTETKPKQEEQNTNRYTSSSGDPTLGSKLGDISMGNHSLAPYYGSDIIVPRPAQSKYPPVAKTAGVSSFSDIQGHWAESDIKRFASNGFISGDPDGRFRPNDPVSYAEFVSIVARFDLKPVRWQGGYLNSFLFKFSSSASKKDWYYNACMVASEAGLFGNIRKFESDKGTEWNGKTAYSLPTLTEPAERQHIAQFAVNLLEYKESDLNTMLNYTDERRINNYSDGVIYNAVKRMVNNNIVTGYPDGSFRPEDTITRAELVVMLTKILDKYQWDMDTISNNMYGNYYLWNWEQAATMANLTNEARQNSSVKALKQDKDLSAIAEIRVIEKTIYGYTSGGGAHCSQFYGNTQQEIAESLGYNGLVGENALMARGNAKSSHDIWMNSEAHKRNLLKDTYIYAGYAIGEDCAYEMFSWK